jgi:ribonuclease E
VIDFIDMMANKNQRAVENRLRDALKIDRARIQLGRISRFGLMEMSRQRLRPSLGESTQLPCPRCKGQGTIRNVESVALAVLRVIEEEAMKKGTEKIIAHLPIECATFLLNEKRPVIEQIETRLKVGIVILPSRHLETPAYNIERLKAKEDIDEKPSYLQIKKEEIAVPEFAQHVSVKAEQPAIREFFPESPAPVQNKQTSTSLIKRFWQKLVGVYEDESSAKAIPEKTAEAGAERYKESRGAGRRGRGRNPRGGRSSGKQPRRPSNAAGNGDETVAPVELPTPEAPRPVSPVTRVEPVIEQTGVPEEAKKTEGRKREYRRNSNRRRSRNYPRNNNFDGANKPETEGGDSETRHPPASAEAPEPQAPAREHSRDDNGSES